MWLYRFLVIDDRPTSLDEVHHLCGIKNDGSPFEIQECGSTLEYEVNSHDYDYFRGRSFIWRTYCHERYLTYACNNMMESLQWPMVTTRCDNTGQVYEYEIFVIVPPFNSDQRWRILNARTDVLREAYRLAAMKDLFDLQSDTLQSYYYHDNYCIAGMLLSAQSVHKFDFQFCCFHPDYVCDFIAGPPNGPFEGDNIVYVIHHEDGTSDALSDYYYEPDD